jgi:hypothetical protein
MNRHLRIATGLAALFVFLAGCGDLAANKPGLDGLTKAVGNVTRSGQSTEAVTASDPRRALTRALIEQAGTPVILVVVTDRNAAATLIRAGVNGDKITWVSTDGIGVILRNGFLIGTRGLGDDLMGADVNGSQSALRRGGTSTRIHDYLSGTDKIVRRSFQCSFTAAGPENIEIFQRVYATTRIDESCADDVTSFVNSYWVAADGTIWKSRQWVSAIVGSLEIMKL